MSKAEHLRIVQQSIRDGKRLRIERDGKTWTIFGLTEKGVIRCSGLGFQRRNYFVNDDELVELSAKCQNEEAELVS